MEKEVDELTESFQYYLLKASNELAKEKVNVIISTVQSIQTRILPIDTYKKEVDEISGRKLSMKWEQLRRDIKEHVYDIHTLAQMPSESSSVFLMLQTALNHLEII